MGSELTSKIPLSYLLALKIKWVFKPLRVFLIASNLFVLPLQQHFAACMGSRRQIGALNSYLPPWTFVKSYFWMILLVYTSAGLKNLHWLSSSVRSKLMIVLQDHNGAFSCAVYDSFVVDSPVNNYTLWVSGYSGNAGWTYFILFHSFQLVCHLNHHIWWHWSIFITYNTYCSWYHSIGNTHVLLPGDSLTFHNGQAFSTYDNDNDDDIFNCASKYQGAWWYRDCHTSNLNGKYLKGSTFGHGMGIIWQNWKGSSYSLKSVEMMVAAVNDPPKPDEKEKKEKNATIASVVKKTSTTTQRPTTEKRQSLFGHLVTRRKKVLWQ